MIYVALVEALAVVATTLTFAQVVRSLIREHARERNLMLNQLLHLAGRTWQPPPADTADGDATLRALTGQLEYLDPAHQPDAY